MPRLTHNAVLATVILDTNADQVLKAYINANNMALGSYPLIMPWPMTWKVDQACNLDALEKCLDVIIERFNREKSKWFGVAFTNPLFAKWLGQWATNELDLAVGDYSVETKTVVESWKRGKCVTLSPCLVEKASQVVDALFDRFEHEAWVHVGR